MEQQDSLCPFSALSLVSPSPFEALETLPTDLDLLHLTWSLPPNYEFMNAVHTVRKELSELKGKVSVLEGESRTNSEQISTLEGKVSELEAEVTQTHLDVVPLADTIHLRCMMDVWVHENGLGPSSGSRTSRIFKNKTRLSRLMQMPEGELEGFFEYDYFCLFVPILTSDFRRYRRLGNSKAHIIVSNGVAHAVTRVAQSLNDNAHFHHLFKSLFKHTVDNELDQAQLFVTHLDSGRDVPPSDRKKKLRKALV